MLRHVVDPVILMRSAPKPRGVQLAALDNVDAVPIPEALRDRLLESAALLVGRGFGPPTYATMDRWRDTNTILALYEHPGDGALGATLVIVPKERPCSTAAHFTTRFADGWKIITANSGIVARTPPPPRTDNAQFLNARNVEHLYAIHRARIAERAKQAPVLPMSRGDDPLGFQDREARETQDHWVAAGYYRYIGDDQMKLTPLGATLAAWRGLQPWKLIAQLRTDRHARDIAKRLGIRFSPIDK